MRTAGGVRAHEANRRLAVPGLLANSKGDLRSMAKSKRDGLFRRGAIWWIRTDPITGKAESTKCRDLEAARLFRSRREREAADPNHARTRNETLRDARDRLIDTRAGLGKSSDYHETKLGHWVRIFGEGADLASVGSPEGFDRYVRQRRSETIGEKTDRVVSNHTISKEVAVMLTTLRMAKRAGAYTGDLSILRPFDLSAGYVPRTRALTAAELGALLGELTPERGAFVALCVGLGLRKGEAFALTAESIDAAAGVVHVPGTKTLASRRTVPILAPFRGLVLAAAKHLPLRSWARGNYLRDLAAACRRAGIELCTPNDLRRTHATLLRNAGVDRDVVRGLLGHAVESSMLETVYDQPRPHELAARAGELVTLTRQLEGAAVGKERGNSGGRAENRTRDNRLVRPSLTTTPSGSTHFRYVEDDGQPGTTAATVTLSEHSPAAHALALAFVNVMRRGAA